MVGYYPKKIFALVWDHRNGSNIDFKLWEVLTLLWLNLQAYQSEKTIEKELKEIEGLLSSNATQAEQWISLVDRLTTELKEMGDISNWLDTLEQVADEIRDISQKL